MYDINDEYVQMIGKAMLVKDEPKLPVGSKVKFQALDGKGNLHGKIGEVKANDALPQHPYKVAFEDGETTFCMRAVLVTVD